MRDYLKLFVIILLFNYASICSAIPFGNGVQGKLIFLGVNHNSSRSVWLSVTSATGSFQLQAQGNQLIDEWSKDGAGLRLSLSPVVSSGNGGTHQLINALNNKKLDSENQQGGVIFPPFPEVPPTGAHPENPIVIPPESPGVPSHPIVIPPESPGVPSHPIVIPPESPGVPSHPIVIPPESPGVPSHPIVIPPESPGVPSHPIVIPPESPGVPSHPIVIPPESPGVPSHPIVIPPESPTKPGRPVMSTPGSQPKTRASMNITNYGAQDTDQTAPITPARQFDVKENWNVWSDNYYYESRDTQLNMNAKGVTTNFIVGADRRITNNLVGGVMLSTVDYDTNAFSGQLDNNQKGFNIGPYFGYQISPKLSFDGFITYGQVQNNNKIVSLNSHFLTRSVTGTIHAIGILQFGKFQLRPQPLISYTHFQNPSYEINGNIRNIPVAITRDKANFNFGFSEFKIEGNYSIEMKNGNIIQPYTEAGVDYVFERPTDGQIYTGNLALASYAPLSELVTLGIRGLIFKKLLIQTSGSYLSFGQQNLDVWNLRLLASYSFS